MHAERHSVTVTTAADGSATAYSPVVTGRVLMIKYAKTDFADGVDFTVTAEATGETLWQENNVNASATKYPRAQVHDNAGAARTYDGTYAVCEPVTLAHDRVKIVIASGGDTKVGVFTIIVG